MKIGRILLLALANVGALCVAAVPAYADNYTFSGEGGFKQSFSLTGGDYEVYLIAKYPARSYEAPDEKHCFFSGMLERTSPTYDKISLGSAEEVSSDNIAPHKYDRVLPLPAGQYALAIASGTNCWWSFTMVLQHPQDSGRRTKAQSPPLDSLCCVDHIVMLKPIDGDPFPALTASVKDHVRFFAKYLNVAPGKPEGFWFLKRDGEAVQAGQLQTGLAPGTQSTIFYADVQWDQRDLKHLGKFTVQFYTSRGNTSAEFTLTQ